MDMIKIPIIFLVLLCILLVILTIIIYRRLIKVGVINIDPNTGLCKFQIETNKLNNLKRNYVIMKVNHNTTVSFEEEDKFA